MKKNLKNLALVLGALPVFLIAIPLVKAQTADELTPYASETGVFQVKIPADHKTAITRMDTKNGTSVYSGETIATIDQRPFKNAVKSFIVKFDQTIGPGLNEKEKETLIRRELDLYENHYASMNSIVQEKTESKRGDTKTGDIYITFEDPKLGLQGVKARVLFSDATRIQQIITGPDHIMRSVKSKEFFESLFLEYGLPANPADMEETWQAHPSPLGIFTARLPPVAKPYVFEDPAIKNTDTSEILGFTVTDPVRAEKLFYRVYGYKFDDKPSFAEAEQTLLVRHIAQYLKIPEGLEIRKSFNAQNVPLIETQYDIPGLKNYPFAKTVKLRCLFLGNVMMVQELIGSHALVDSDFAGSLFAQTEFHSKPPQESPVTEAPSAPPASP